MESFQGLRFYPILESIYFKKHLKRNFPMSIRLYIGNLPKELERQELDAVFSEVESGTVSTKIITDRKTGKCRGFGFVTVQTDEQADQIIEKYNGYTLKDTILKIEKALPRAKGGKNEGGGEDGEEMAEPQANNAVNLGGGNGTVSNNNNRKKSGSKSRRNTNANANTTTKTTDTGTFQPDPRWAGKLEKLKELLAAQTTGS